MMPSIMCYAPPSVELLAPTTPVLNRIGASAGAIFGFKTISPLSSPTVSKKMCSNALSSRLTANLSTRLVYRPLMSCSRSCDIQMYVELHFLQYKQRILAPLLGLRLFLEATLYYMSESNCN